MSSSPMSKVGFNLAYNPAVTKMREVLKMCEDKGIDQEVTSQVREAIKLAEMRDAYCDKNSSTPSPALEALKTETLNYPFQKAFDDGKTFWNLNPRMMSGHLEGKFLQSLVSMSNAKRVLEVGMFTGYAALACAECIPEDGTVTTCEIDPFLDTLARELLSKSSHGKKVIIKVGPAQETLEQLVKDKVEPYDLVFIDADKPGYVNYFKTILDKGLLAPRGSVVLDNLFMGGRAYTPAKEGTNDFGEGIRKVNEYLGTRDDIFRVLVPIRDGVGIVRRKADTYT